jgi:death-on-curing protein
MSRGKKAVPPNSGAERSPKKTPVLDRLEPWEAQAVLRRLLAAHPNLGIEAERISKSLDTIHSELLLEHGGAVGVAAGGDDLLESVLVESVLARPKNRLAYEPDSDLATLAAAYLFGLVKNHAYVDGNKRVGFAAAATFQRLNGLRLTASESDAYDAVIEVVEGSRTESDLARWLRENTEPIR